MPFRAAACTGALYHVELYVVCRDLPDLEAGVYHYAAHDHALRQLRRGDFRAGAGRGDGRRAGVARRRPRSCAPAPSGATPGSTRRAPTATASGTPARCWPISSPWPPPTLSGAARPRLRRCAGRIDCSTSIRPGGAICLVALGRLAAAAAARAAGRPLDLPTQRLSPREVDYPAIARDARGLVARFGRRGGGVAGCGGQGGGAPRGADGAGAGLVPLTLCRRLPLRPRSRTVIRRRGSARRFTARADRLRAALDDPRPPRTHRGRPADPRRPMGAPLTDPYLIVNAVDGLPPGAYALDRAQPALELLEPGRLPRRGGLPRSRPGAGSRCAVNVYSLADLRAVLPRFGNRGYRAAQLEVASRAANSTSPPTRSASARPD